MTVRIAQVWDLVQKTLESPAQHNVEFALLLAIALLFLSIVVLAIVATLQPRRSDEVRRSGRAALALGQRPEGTGVAEETRHGNRWPAWRIAAVLVLVSAAVISTYLETGSDAYCTGSCHRSQEAVIGAASIRHAACVDCHEGVGIAGIAGNGLQRLTMATDALLKRQPGHAVVDSHSCLRCHDAVLRGTVSSGDLRMSHAETNAAGRTCQSCHGAVGHSRSRRYSMSSCIVCHDGKRASTECLTCHETRPLASSEQSTASVGSGRVTYSSVELEPECGGCHDETKDCDSCHGLRMPHPASFSGSGHAAVAAFEGKTLCRRCHDTTFCSPCHGPFTAHPPDWKRTHASNRWNEPCPCHAQRSGTSTCYECHESSPPHRLRR